MQWWIFIFVLTLLALILAMRTPRAKVITIYKNVFPGVAEKQAKKEQVLTLFKTLPATQGLVPKPSPKFHALSLHS